MVAWEGMGPWGDLGGSSWTWGPGRAGCPRQNKISFPELRMEMGIVETTEVVVRESEKRGSWGRSLGTGF